MALLRIDVCGANIPVLELDITGKGTVVGEPIILLFEIQRKVKRCEEGKVYGK